MGGDGGVTQAAALPIAATVTPPTAGVPWPVTATTMASSTVPPVASPLRSTAGVSGTVHGAPNQWVQAKSGTVDPKQPAKVRVGAGASAVDAASSAEWRGRAAMFAEVGIDPPDGWEGPGELSLPPGAERWTRLERDLFLQSEGVYNPQQLARRRRVGKDGFQVGGASSSCEVVGRVSVVTPTMSSRAKHHEQLWGCFESQTWEDKELVVVEDYETEPSEFLRRKAEEDGRLVLVSFQRDAGKDFNVGLKRNMTLHLASGEFIVNFDDDDIYATTYIERMIEQLRARNLAAMTLSCWYNYFTLSGVCGYSDRDCWVDEEDLDDVLYGYGFSYVHRRSIALVLPYPNEDFAEDAPFMLRLRKLLGDDRVALKDDKEGLCMHMMHRANSTGDPEFSRHLEPAEVAELEVARSPVFIPYLSKVVGPSWLWRMARGGGGDHHVGVWQSSRVLSTCGAWFWPPGNEPATGADRQRKTACF